MTTDHDALLELVLGYEELDDAARARADAHLATCAACREALDRVRRFEHGARSLAPPAGFDLPAPAPDAALHAEAERSLAALRARLGLDAEAVAQEPPRPRAVVVPAPRRVPRWVHVLAPAAAAAAVVVFALWPRPAAPPPTVHGLAIAPWSGTRGPQDGLWRTGDAFVLRFRLDRPARIAVVHVGPDGHATLLHPGEGEAALPGYAAGDVQLPDPAADVVWRFEGEPGAETFLVAIAESRDVPVRDLAAAVRALDPRGERDARVRDATALLEKSVGPVRSIEVRHRP
jgi:hypothetical protein